MGNNTLGEKLIFDVGFWKVRKYREQLRPDSCSDRHFASFELQLDRV